jgi:hypothetical protein
VKNAPQRSLVVLPFRNLSSAGDDGYLADGITDDLTTDLLLRVVVKAEWTLVTNNAIEFRGRCREIHVNPRRRVPHSHGAWGRTGASIRGCAGSSQRKSHRVNRVLEVTLGLGGEAAVTVKDLS